MMAEEVRTQEVMPIHGISVVTPTTGKLMTACEVLASMDHFFINMPFPVVSETPRPGEVMMVVFGRHMRDQVTCPVCQAKMMIKPELERLQMLDDMSRGIPHCGPPLPAKPSLTNMDRIREAEAAEHKLIMVARKAMVMWLRDNLTLVSMKPHGWLSEMSEQEVTKVLNAAPSNDVIMVMIEDELNITAMAYAVVDALIQTNLKPEH